jgi:2-dehydro-3-deoxygalactonokinase
MVIAMRQDGAATVPALIGVDWGTSSLRAYLLDPSGAVLDRREAADGILAIRADGFAACLAGHVASWRARHPALPIVLSGMIGSRQGWREAPYADCPAGVRAIAAGLLRFDAGALGPVAIVPGLVTREGGTPDVMRGEETQIIGALAASSDRDGVFVLPGTHAKWARVERGEIVEFKTYMTGEVFAALKGHTILGRLMSEPARDDADAFARGVGAGARAGSPGALLNRLFSARTLGLFDEIAGDALASYLSGLLIGAEIGDRHRSAAAITIIASAELTARYQTACRHLDIPTERAPADCAARGLAAIAGAAGLIEAPA